ncbi:MAG: glycosyltransferase, partial [Deltaproteobacteria bacterium]|nr:glycosyltransferase [Deltaproteobacteria bacterium]
MIDCFLPIDSRRRRVVKQIVNLFSAINRQNIRISLSYIKMYGFAAFMRKVSEKSRGDRSRYQAWIKKNEPSSKELCAQKKTRFRHEPKISIAVPTFNTPEKFLRDMVESVMDQTYPNWELCMADGGSKEALVKEILGEYAGKDSRVKVKFLDENKGIAGNSNEALSLASGDYIALLDHDDMLPPFALFEVVRAINKNPGAEFIYSDEDKISEDGKRRFDPHFKPDWAPDTMLSYNYICHLSVIKKDIIDRIGGFREGFDGAQDYDLFLRASRKTDNIIHIRKVLYHWRAHRLSTAQRSDTKPYAVTSGQRAIRDYLCSNGREARVSEDTVLITYGVSYEIEGDPMVSIIIPSRDKAGLLKKCIASVLAK